MNGRMTSRLLMVGMVVFCLALAGVAAAETTGDVTWSGASGTDLLWSTDGNWSGGEAPAHDTTGKILYGTAGQAAKGVLDAAYTVGGIVGGASASTDHKLDLGTKTLTVRGDFSSLQGGTFTVQNGILKIGTDDLAGNILLGRGDLAKLLFSSTGKLNAYNVDTIRLGGNVNYVEMGAVLDLRGAEVLGRVLRAKNLEVHGRVGSSPPSAFYFDAGTLD